MKFAAAGGVVALAILFGAIMAVRSGGDDTSTTETAEPGEIDEESAEPTPTSADATETTDATELEEADSATESSDTTAASETTDAVESTEPDQLTERVQAVFFDTGETSTVVDGTVGPSERMVYTIDAQAGQNLILNLTASTGSPTYEVYGPFEAGNGDTPLVDDSIASSTTVTDDGQHQVIVTAPDASEFVLSIEIPAPQLRLDDFVDPTGIEEIRFAPGGISATISSAVVRAEAEIYTFDTNDDVTAFVTITSVENNAVFQIYDPFGEQLAFESTNSSWAIEDAGLYTIIVTGTRGNASFDLTLELS